MMLALHVVHIVVYGIEIMTVHAYAKAAGCLSMNAHAYAKAAGCLYITYQESRTLCPYAPQPHTAVGRARSTESTRPYVARASVSHTDSLQEAAKSAPSDEVAPIATPTKGCADLLAFTRKSHQLRGRSRRSVQNEATLRVVPVVQTTTLWRSHGGVVGTTGGMRSIASFCTARRDLPRSWFDVRI